MTQASEDNDETDAIGGNRSVVRENSVRLQSHDTLLGRSFQKQQAQTLSPGFHSHSRYRPAQALAKFFTLLEQKKLVSEPACSEMNDLLDGNVWRRAYSYLGYAIPLSGKACTKIGFLDAEHGYHDAGWIMYDAKNYVAVVLNARIPGNIVSARIKLESCL